MGGGGRGWEAEGALRLPLRQVHVCPVSGTNSHNCNSQDRRRHAAVGYSLAPHTLHPY